MSAVYVATLLYPAFCSCDLDLDAMTLKYELDVDILKMPAYQKELSR